MARYEITTETDRSIVSRTTGKLPADVRVRHHARSMEHALGDLLRLEIRPDGSYSLWRTVHRSDGSRDRVEETFRGHLVGPDAPYAYARIRPRDDDGPEWRGVHDGRQYRNP